jgi:hypothetical protein
LKIGQEALVAGRRNFGEKYWTKNKEVEIIKKRRATFLNVTFYDYFSQIHKTTMRIKLDTTVTY